MRIVDGISSSILSNTLRTIVIDADGTLIAEATAPPSLNALGVVGSMGKDEPETKDGLGEDVENSVGNDFSIDTPHTGTITNTPDDWVQSPEDKGEATDGGEELAGLVVLGGNSTTAADDKLPDDDKVGNACHGIPSPLLATGRAVGSKETGEDHYQVSDDSNENACSVHAGKECKVEEEKRGGQAPVNIAGPENLTEDVLVGVGNVLVGLLDDDLGKVVSVTSSHGKV